MAKLDLNLHAGGFRVAREVLDSVPTPRATETWSPIPHATLVDGIQSTIERSGLRVVAEAHALAKEGNRYFGLMQLESGPNAADYSLVVGLRNSHDKSIPAGLAVGSGVFVCSNLAFSAEITLSRKHTVNIERDLPSLIERAVGRLADVRGRQDERIAAYKHTEITDGQAHDLLVQGLDARVFPVTYLPDVLAEWRAPRHPEFAQGKTAWRFLNAATETLKKTSLFRRPAATAALHGILDSMCGLN